MYLKELSCRGFRCLADVQFAPSPGINVIRGENAQGKTSLLETVLFAATSKSHRTNLETELVCHGREDFHIRLEVVRSDREVVLETHWSHGDKRVKINGVSQGRMSEILGKVRVVFFSPEDIALVKGNATTRRRFLDMELSQLSPAYLTALQHYRQVLRQRNELLRVDRPDGGLLDVWDEQLVDHARTLIEERAAFVSELGACAATAYDTIAADEKLDIAYAPDTPLEGIEEAIRAGRAVDIRRRQTIHGPHRDDIHVVIDGQPARSHASQGQQKSAALSIKLAELELIHSRTGEYPILMLDEVLAELDDQRANRLFEAINPEVQCLLSTTEKNERDATHGRAITNFRIRDGALATD